MKKHVFYSLGFILIATLFYACDDDNPGGGSNGKKLPDNEWVRNTMESVYLWNDEVKKKSVNSNLGTESYFYALLSSKDGKTDETGYHHYYSYITPKESNARAINSESTYGFEYVLYRVQGQSYYYARVIYVLPNSPAEDAELERGDWIMYIDGEHIDSSNYNKLQNGGGIKLGLDYENQPRELTLEASYKIEENPIFLNKIFEISGKKIGYLVYNQFATGPGDDPKITTYNEQMKDIFNNKFSKENVDEFILDLRYNGGGYLSCAQLLGGLIVSQQHKNDVFCITKDNKNKSLSYGFTEGGSHLNLSRLFVLVSSQTASASEAIINCLKPYMDVILIGNQTEGKNVGSERIEDDQYDWILQPIMVQIYNAKNESDYANGFKTDYEMNEFDTSENKLLHPLGDTNEYYLKKAISIITGKNTMFAPETKRSNSVSSSRIVEKPFMNSVTRKQAHAVLMD